MAMTGGTAKLVKTGYANGDTDYPISLYVYYKTSPDVSTNKSTITVGMYVTSPSSSYGIGKWDDFNGSYVGTSSLTFDGTIPNFKGTYWIAENKTFTVTHNDDGTGKATIYWKWGVNSPWGGMQNPSGSFEITLPTIARKSTVSCPTSGTMKSDVVISIDRKSTTAFTHTLKYTFGGTTELIKYEVNSDSYTWSIPDLAAKCNNAKSGTCTITCETYSGGTLVGTTTDTMTLNVPVATTPTFSASSVKMGTSVTINTARNSSNYTHTLSYSFGGASDTIATGVTTEKTWTVPDLAAKCNNATKGTCTITCKTYNGTALVDTKTKTLTLTVQDASTPTLSASTVAMGNNLTIYTNRKSSNFTHKITYSFNGATDPLDTDATTSYAWNPVPLDLAKKIPKATKGTGTITCDTYNGTAKVGTKTVDFTATVPNNSTTQPLLTEFNITPSGSIPSAFSGLYIQGKTRVEASFSASSVYSTIASYQLGMEGVWLSGNPVTSNVIVGTGRRNVACIVTDARGYSTRVDKSVTAIPYNRPRIIPHSGEKAVVCERCTSDGTPSNSGMYLKIKVGQNYSKVMSGETQKNFCTLGYRYKASAATSYSSDVILINSNDTFDEVESEPIPGVVESLITSYDVQIFVKDTMGETDEYTIRVPTAGTDFNLREGGKGAAFGKYAERENGVEFEWDVYGRAYGLGNLIEIPRDSDLNDEKYRVFGCYAIRLDSIAETIQNLPPLPAPKAGILRVYSSNGTYSDDDNFVYITQEFTPYNGNGFYRRFLEKNGDEGWNFESDVEARKERCRWKAFGGVDAVVESGSVIKSGVTWHYKKWFDGTAECWARRSVTVDTTGQWGSLYSAGISSISLPLTFIEPPVCNITVENGASEHYFFVGAGGQATKTTAPQILIFRLTSTTGVDVNVLYNVHGKWK